MQLIPLGGIGLLAVSLHPEKGDVTTMIGVLLLVFGATSILFSTLFFYAACVVASDEPVTTHQIKPDAQRPNIDSTRPASANVTPFTSHKVHGQVPY